MKKSRKILFISLLIICIIAINFSVYWQFFREEKKENQEEYELKMEQAIQDFDSIFQNQIDNQNNTVPDTIKKEIDKELVYTKIQKTELKDGEYHINVNIPTINLNTNTMEECNKQIESIFKTKLDSILSQKQSNTIYTVEYEAYLNTNILSLVIKATLKEGDYPQRVIIQTYNYNISTNQLVSLKELIQIRGLTDNAVTETIQKRIEEENKQAVQLQQITGQSIYTRDLNSNIYELENTNIYFLGKDNIFYILYPYGNANYTSELDIIAF